MSALIAALALFAAAEPAGSAPAYNDRTLTEDMPYPAGAPHAPPCRVGAPHTDDQTRDCEERSDTPRG